MIPQLLGYISDGKKTIIVFEDLGQKRLSSHPERLPEAIEAIAVLHSLPHRDFPKPYAANCDEALSVLSHLMSDGFYSEKPELSLMFRDAWQRSGERLRTLPMSVIHTDAHLDNWAITTEGKLVLFDWSRARCGRSLVDLVRLLTYPNVDQPQLLTPDKARKMIGLYQDITHISIDDNLLQAAAVFMILVAVAFENQAAKTRLVSCDSLERQQNRTRQLTDMLVTASRLSAHHFIHPVTKALLA